MTHTSRARRDRSARDAAVVTARAATRQRANSIVTAAATTGVPIPKEA